MLPLSVSITACLPPELFAPAGTSRPPDEELQPPRQTAARITKSALFPPAITFLHRQDPHERFHGVDLTVVDLEHLPHRQLIAAALAHPPGHAQPYDAHALVGGDDARLHVAEALEDRERLGGDVLAAGSKGAGRSGHHLAVLQAIGSWRERCVHGGEGLRGIEPFRVLQRRSDGLVSSRELPGTWRVAHHRTRRAHPVDVEDEAFRAAACG